MYKNKVDIFDNILFFRKKYAEYFKKHNKKQYMFID